MQLRGDDGAGLLEGCVEIRVAHDPEYQYQTKSKCHETFRIFSFNPEDNLRVKEVPEVRPVGPTRHQGAQEAPVAPWWVVRPIGPLSTASQLYKYPNIPETLWGQGDQSFHRRKFRAMRSNLEAFSGTLPEWETITEGFIILIGAPPMMHL
ncbi:uncharacterized protein LOC125523176 [Triticum urartu]|uniref:uncharacterized protein LOC125523176 n=1 Tax=Triticum urartu TaxID=4572 RepID=UPI0020445854|nr:uncharacterized protein LOC125523176 [Triticum urartu]